MHQLGTSDILLFKRANLKNQREYYMDVVVFSCVFVYIISTLSKEEMVSGESFSVF